MAKFNHPPRSHGEDFPWDRYLCAKALATTPNRLVGRMAPVDYMFPIARSDGAAEREAMVAFLCEYSTTDLFIDLPLSHLTALRFVLNDIFNPIPIGRLHGPIPPALLPQGPSRSLANLATGALSLCSVYGGIGLVGDVAQVLARCTRWPWNRSRLWSEAHPTSEVGGGDVLRLHRTIGGDGAPLRERYFHTLPNHLRPAFFAEDELLMDRAIIPDARNDATLLLSQFHAAIVRYHNAVADCLGEREEFLAMSPDIPDAARTETVLHFGQAVVADLLPRICAPEMLEWSSLHGAILSQRLAVKNRTPYALPFEAAVLLTILLERQRPASFRPNAASETTDLLAIEQSPSGCPIKLPSIFFENPKAPLRLAIENQVDWEFVARTDPTQTLRTVGRLPPNTSRMANALSFFPSLALPTGERCINFLNNAFGLDVPTLTRAEIKQMGTPDALAKDGATSFLAYVLIEATVLGENGRLGPLGSVVLSECLLGAVGSNIMDGDRSFPNILSLLTARSTSPCQ